MRVLYALTLGLALGAPAWADTPYHIETVLFRPGGSVVEASQLPGPEWRADATDLPASLITPPQFGATLDKLKAQNYPILLQQSWTQTIGATPHPVALTNGEAHQGQYPVQGRISLTETDPPTLDVTFWVNHFDAQGNLLNSERLKSTQRLQPGKMTYIDHPSLGLLVRIDRK